MVLGNYVSRFYSGYEYLPYSGILKKHELNYTSIITNTVKRINTKRNEKIRKTGLVKILNKLKRILYYDCEVNQRINDKRADSYYLTRTFLFVNLILLIVLGVIGYLK